MTYQPGDRVALVHTADPHTLLQPDDLGTVRRHHRDLDLLDIDWDSGSRLSLCLDAGDSVHTITTGTPPASDIVVRLLDAAYQAGAAAGRQAADWWAQHTVGGQAHGDTASTARRILAGIDDGDPAVLDQLPTTTPIRSARTSSTPTGTPTPSEWARPPGPTSPPGSVRTPTTPTATGTPPPQPTGLPSTAGTRPPRRHAAGTRAT